MKGVIFYYSATGNTRLACEYIVNRLKNASFDLVDIADKRDLDVASYDMAGFAVPADFQGPPYLMQQFIDRLQPGQQKPAFVLNTYGMVSGQTLKVLADWVSRKGFCVAAGFSLQTPENYPPMVARGLTSKNAPKSKDLQKLNSFIAELDNILVVLKDGQPKEARLKIGLFNSLMGTRPRTAARDDMGEKFVDEQLCNSCGHCKTVCPYDAVELNPKPVFDMGKCYGCWSCFNLCPTKAIYTKKFRGKGHYPKPLESLREKLT